MPLWADKTARFRLHRRLLPALAGLATELVYVLALLAAGLLIAAAAARLR